MRICNVDKIPQKAILAKNIYDTKGVFLLKKDTQLNCELVKKIKMNGLFYIYIEDSISEGIEIQTVIDDEAKADIIFSFRDIFEKKISGNRTPDLISSGSISALDNLVDVILSEISNKHDLSYMAVELMGTDMSTYSHCVNTAIISLLMAIDLKMGMRKCKDIGMGAILHDIGKIQIDSDILNKLSPFTPEEFEEMKRHSEYGYNMIKGKTMLNGVVKSIVIHHHEKLDGLGYPHKLGKNKIPDYVRIVTIADMFDAMTSDRVYRKRMPVHVVLENLMVDCVNKTDPIIFDSLVRQIVMYPPGTVAHLNDGSRTIVTEYNKLSPTRPKLRILESPNYQQGNEIDLMKELRLLIVSTET